jgi:hypothetical protein
MRIITLNLTDLNFFESLVFDRSRTIIWCEFSDYVLWNKPFLARDLITVS